MIQLAQLNIGRLVADTDDPRVAGFMTALDRVNGLARRMPGFVWMMEGSGGPGTGNTDTAIGGDPRSISNLSVWEGLAPLERFVFGTLHRRFLDRRQEWFEVPGDLHFVLWPVASGHRPTLDEALERLALRQREGDSPAAHGWDWARKQAGLGGAIRPR
ncbi:MAG: DUF3291 domain-containing protein [Rubellimicrobium sp.]|nr:DUF3291 domain-containing protein [Rubellimicrobium sp.]